MERNDFWPQNDSSPKTHGDIMEAFQLTPNSVASSFRNPGGLEEKVETRLVLLPRWFKFAIFGVIVIAVASKL